MDWLTLGKACEPVVKVEKQERCGLKASDGACERGGGQTSLLLTTFNLIIMFLSNLLPFVLRFPHCAQGIYFFHFLKGL